VGNPKPRAAGAARFDAHIWRHGVGRCVEPRHVLGRNLQRVTLPDGRDPHPHYRLVVHSLAGAVSALVHLCGVPMGDTVRERVRHEGDRICVGDRMAIKSRHAHAAETLCGHAKGSRSGAQDANHDCMS